MIMITIIIWLSSNSFWIFGCIHSLDSLRNTLFLFFAERFLRITMRYQYNIIFLEATKTRTDDLLKTHTGGTESAGETTDVGGEEKTNPNVGYIFR